ncbi:signal transduction histidine kinase [Methylophilaceae bacterium 11]|uniref:ATP-binding protein n=1 Tax=Methylotenera sp. 1P/1 TaxID=1131551 RepID=UPI0003A7DCE9|nr:ATP-binding protein [Methylotenera sp. 1P/1]EUJ11373.1 signal transduction histidine kinase [Methylophilaceae bacterium 11]
MRLLPRTLLSRLLLLIALLLAISIYASLKIFDYFDREPRATTAALQAVTIVNYTRASLIASHENRRLALLSELSGREGVRVYAADFLEDIEPLPQDPFINLIAQKIRERLGDETIITVNHYDIPGLWISFNVGQDDFWVVIPKIQVDRPFPWHWLGWAAVVGLLSLLGAYIIASRINRPLNLLVHAAERLRNGEPAPKLPEDSVEELREVSRTFNEMAESLVRLDAERTLLLAGVSHDIRTPLARLRLAVEMLSGGTGDSMKQGMIEDISDMDNIIHQFLDFVRGVEGEPTKMVDINELLRSLAERQARAGRNLKLNLTATYYIPLRPLAMQRLLDNLVGNAYAYAKGEVAVSSKITADKIIISVLDNGPGIPPEHAQRLLRPFERMDSARNKNEGGSGLGLAICNRIAKLHRGSLELINRPQGGLEARLSLPIMH